MMSPWSIGLVTRVSPRPTELREHDLDDAADGGRLSRGGEGLIIATPA
jgi:hypothetical protein